jgi:hypothetical protein
LHAGGGRLTPIRPQAGDGPSPAGGAYTTADDLLKLSNALLAGRLLDKAHTDLVLNGQAKIGGHIGAAAPELREDPVFRTLDGVLRTRTW